MKKLPTFLTLEEFEKVFKAEKDKKFKLAYLLGFKAGMRLSEIVGLPKLYSKCCDAETISGTIEIDGHKRKRLMCSKCKAIVHHNKECYRKAGTFEIEPLSKDRVDLARHTILISQGKGKKDRIVPLPKEFNQNALNMLPLAIPRSTLQRNFRVLCRKVLDKDLHFHSLRHGFVTHLMNSGRPFHEIQALAGHSRGDTTAQYAHANPTKAVEGARDVF